MSFKESKFESITIESACEIEGQDCRCSLNYDMTQLVETPRMRWTIEPIEGVDVSKITFKLFQDCSGKDKELTRSMITSGAVTLFFATDKLYVGDVGYLKNTTFRITVTPTFELK
ncbi:MAG: hypothetical protein LUG99_11670 [Lachnospiraceae bacterium]|nr:hypothetical protein [Lachnospiraceae bacterium]